MLILELYIFVLAAFVGYMVISRVPPLLHTPLMAATNAISGISLVGSMVAAGSGRGVTATALGTIAVAAASPNAGGGGGEPQRGGRIRHHRPHAAHVQEARGQEVSAELVVQLCYLAASILF